MKRLASAIVHVALFGAFATCNYAVVMQLAATLDDREPPICLGPANARNHVVYLHGLDSRTPSWQELDNRRALTALSDTATAIPRARACGAGRCWSDRDEDRGDTIQAIRDAARTCFGERTRFGVIGFSRGGFALARIAACEEVGASWAIVAGAFGYTEDMRLQDCPVGVVIGRHDRYHRRGAIEFAQRRRAAGLSTVLVEPETGHRLDTDALSTAILELEHAEPMR